MDGGASANKFLLQFQADITGKQIVRPTCIETTALGAACLAGLAVGVYDSLEAIRAIYHHDVQFDAQMTSEQRDTLYDGWKKAVDRTLSE